MSLLCLWGMSWLICILAIVGALWIMSWPRIKWGLS